MLTLLMQTNRKYSVNDLAELLEVDRRTIYRYISTFNEAGFVVQTSNRHVRLAQNTQIHRQLSELLYFNQEEALTLYNAIDAIESDTERKTELKRKLAAIYGTKAVQELSEYAKQLVQIEMFREEPPSEIAYGSNGASPSCCAGQLLIAQQQYDIRPACRAILPE